MREKFLKLSWNSRSQERQVESGGKSWPGDNFDFVVDSKDGSVTFWKIRWHFNLTKTFLKIYNYYKYSKGILVLYIIMEYYGSITFDTYNMWLWNLFELDREKIEKF